MERRGNEQGAEGAMVTAGHGRPPAEAAPRRAPAWTRCDACGEGMQSMGHCKWLCRACGFLRTCIDTV
jgi:hypothetical protein